MLYLTILVFSMLEMTGGTREQILYKPIYAWTGEIWEEKQLVICFYVTKLATAFLRSHKQRPSEP